MTLRRVFTTPDRGQLLVTIDGNQVQVATRKESWHTWEAPLPLDYTDDDPVTM